MPFIYIRYIARLQITIFLLKIFFYFALVCGTADHMQLVLQSTSCILRITKPKLDGIGKYDVDILSLQWSALQSLCRSYGRSAGWHCLGLFRTVVRDLDRGILTIHALLGAPLRL